jgi:hypothetical protein
MDPAIVINMSTGGLVLQGIRRRIRAGELLDVRMGKQKAEFRVVWVGATGDLGMQSVLFAGRCCLLALKRRRRQPLSRLSTPPFSTPRRAGIYCLNYGSLFSARPKRQISVKVPDRESSLNAGSLTIFGSRFADSRRGQ